jgi:hypothetical protein
MVTSVQTRTPFVTGALVAGLVLTGCGSSGPSAAPTTSAAPTATAAPTTTAAPSTGAPGQSTTTVAVTTGAATCPTMAQADAALGVSNSGPVHTATPGGGIVCEYSGSGGSAAVTIFTHQSASVFTGQVAHAPGAPAMAAIPGLGDGAYGQDVGGRGIVNAYANASRTLVAAQAPGPLPPVEALARVALADN